jgi:hypothetical protein
MTTTPLPRFSTLEQLPAGYKQTSRLAIDSRRAFLRLNFASLIPLVIGLLFFNSIDQLLRLIQLPVLLSVPFNNGTRPAITVLALVMTVLLLSIHELCHGLAYRAFGAKVRYGINWRKAVAYAAAEHHYLTRDAYIVVALAPLVIITVACILGMALTDGVIRFLFGLMGTVNAGAAVGDVWFTLVCIRQPQTLLVRDYGDGAELYTTEGENSGE